jgi:hypothetical protein
MYYIQGAIVVHLQHKTMKPLVLIAIPLALAGPTFAQQFHCTYQAPPDPNSPAPLAEDHAPLVDDDRGATYTVPIVFHVLYHTPAQNVSDAVILQQLQVLNQDFSRTNPDAVNTPAALQSLAAATNIRFCLATRDPNGNPTTGITHTYTDTALWMDTWLGNSYFFNPATGGVAAWDPFHYLNVYVIDRSFFGGTASSGPHGQFWDVIGIDYPYIGNDHTLSHEVGHYFALAHVFGGTSGEQSCGNDLVDDTPPQTFHYNCPSYPFYSCGNTDISDLFMNYMDYSPSSCKNMFTAGQAQRMRSSLLGARAELLNSTACGPVGLSDAVAGTAAPLRITVHNGLVELATTNGALLQGPLRVYTSTGQIIHARDPGPNTGHIQRIDLQHAGPGVYLIQLGTQHTDRHTVRIAIGE